MLIARCVLGVSIDEATAFSPLFEGPSVPDTECASPFIDALSLLDVDARTRIVASASLHFLKAGMLDARVRSLLRLFSDALNVSWALIAAAEDAYILNPRQDYTRVRDSHSDPPPASPLMPPSEPPPPPTTARVPGGGAGRAFAVGGATVLGALALGLTGGLAAPALIAGAGFFASVTASAIGAGAVAGAATAVATAAGAVTASTTGAVIVFASFGAAGAVSSGRAMIHRTGSASSHLVCLSNVAATSTSNTGGGFAVTIVVSGLCFTDSAGPDLQWFFTPWGGVENREVPLNAPVTVHCAKEADALRDSSPLPAETSEWAPRRTSDGWWRRRFRGGQLLALVFDPAELAALSDMLDKQIRAALQSTALSQALKMTALHTLLAAWTLPSYVLSALTMIDNPWSVAAARATDAGHTLAMDILQGAHGRRPISLIGFGLGAVVCFTAACDIAAATAAASTPPLLAFAVEADAAARSRPLEAAAILQDVVLMGAPLPTELGEWAAVRRAASGRVVNCYTTNDLVLTFMYRLRTGRFACAGLSVIGGDKARAPVSEHAPHVWRGIESFDVSDIVTGHLGYPSAMEAVSVRIGL